MIARINYRKDNDMITIDNTHGRSANYEVILKIDDLTIRCLNHHYSDARQQFTSAVNAHIIGLTVLLNDLTGISGC